MDHTKPIHIIIVTDFELRLPLCVRVCVCRAKLYIA